MQHAQAGNVGLINLPPGIVVKAINAGGSIYEGRDYRVQPDVYASVQPGQLKANLEFREIP